MQQLDIPGRPNHFPDEAGVGLHRREHPPGIRAALFRLYQHDQQIGHEQEELEDHHIHGDRAKRDQEAEQAEGFRDHIHHLVDTGDHVGRFPNQTLGEDACAFGVDMLRLDPKDISRRLRPHLPAHDVVGPLQKVRAEIGEEAVAQLDRQDRDKISSKCASAFCFWYFSSISSKNKRLRILLYSSTPLSAK